ncbi:MAG: ATP synthase F1 subunit epsilon [Candidatus Magasanikbacteria bacterium RIFCSPLOWO2_02_FULL_44_11]|uniref:ATP synthase epsilon chain n=2 Tax=Candidatus Magasanikiibacteriota TaxID=1752731 RepID=A0A1F6NBT1_9BACT|nr:MAG: ATP synthase F1 subunit epsilon [Candidatus Magasanikbacteria bacterium RIFCSPHIGHO2_02_FULL_45_10]OGH81230.1 MAG: ATP synthase F1 subunit epsilon [Candidatus Magasanikbacteria bacterium RIFCSPLOWO2_02_FULL_44_11]
MHMHFQIITPEREVFSDEIDQISLMTEDGEITVLPHHIPLVTNLKPGELRYKKKTEEITLAVSGGFGVVRPNGSVIVLADTAEHAHEIDLKRAEEARSRAAKLMEESRNKEDINYTSLALKLEKELTRLRVGNRYRKLP